MIETIEKLGYTTGISFFLAGAIYFIKSSWDTIREKRFNEASKVLDRMIEELENSLVKFYIPLGERFTATKHINSTMIQNAYSEENHKRILPGAPKGAMRDIAVNRILLPLNKEIKKLLLDNVSCKNPSDPTNYENILTHYLVWEALEESKNEGQIEVYHGDGLLEFPSEELETFFDVFNNLMLKRENLRYELLSIRGMPKSFLKYSVNRGCYMKRKNLQFQKSTFSDNYKPTCVGVARNGEKIVLTNTNSMKEFVDFTPDEWDAFIKGVKAGEFDSYAK